MHRGVTLGPRFRDGLGVRVVEIDEVSGDTVEILHLTPELASFERSIKERTSRLVSFRHPRFVPVRGVEAVSGHAGRLGVVSDHVVGLRLSEILEAVRTSRTVVDANAALQLVRELLAAVSVLHDSRSVTHGAIGPERLILTPRGRLVIADYCLGLALERLEYSRQLLWRNYRIPVSVGAGIARLDKRVDVIQVGCVALALFVGKPLDASSQGNSLKAVIDEAIEATTHGERKSLSSNLRAWLERVLPIETRKPFATAQQANVALEQLLVKERRFSVAPAALRAFVGRVLAASGDRFGEHAGLAATTAPADSSAIEVVEETESAAESAAVVTGLPHVVEAAPAEAMAPEVSEQARTVVSADVLASIAGDLDRLGDPVLRAILGVPEAGDPAATASVAGPHPLGEPRIASPESAATEAAPPGESRPGPSPFATATPLPAPDDGIPIVLDEVETRAQLASIPADRDEELLPSAARVPEPASPVVSVDLEATALPAPQPAVEPIEIALPAAAPPAETEATGALEPVEAVLDAAHDVGEPSVVESERRAPEPLVAAAPMIDEPPAADVEPPASEPLAAAAQALGEPPASKPLVAAAPTIDEPPAADVELSTGVSDVTAPQPGDESGGDAVLLPPDEAAAVADGRAPEAPAVDDVWVIDATDLTLDASLLKGLHLAPNIRLDAAWPAAGTESPHGEEARHGETAIPERAVEEATGVTEPAGPEAQLEPTRAMSSPAVHAAAFDEIIAHVIAASSSPEPESAAPPAEVPLENVGVVVSEQEPTEFAAAPPGPAEETEVGLSLVGESPAEPAAGITAGPPPKVPEIDLSSGSAAVAPDEAPPTAVPPREEAPAPPVSVGEIGDEFVAARDGLRQFISSIRAKWFRHGAASPREEPGRASREAAGPMPATPPSDAVAAGAPPTEEPRPAIEEPPATATTEASEPVAEVQPAEAPQVTAVLPPASPTAVDTVCMDTVVPELETMPLPEECGLGPELVAVDESVPVCEEPPATSETAELDLVDEAEDTSEGARPAAEPGEVEVVRSLIEESEAPVDRPAAEAPADEQESVALGEVPASDLSAVLPIAVEITEPAAAAVSEIDTSWAPPVPVPEGSAPQVEQAADLAPERPKRDSRRAGRRHARRRRHPREIEQAVPVLQLVPRGRLDEEVSTPPVSEAQRTSDLSEPQLGSVEPSVHETLAAGQPAPPELLDAVPEDVAAVADSQTALIPDRPPTADFPALQADRPIRTGGGILFGGTEEENVAGAHAPHDVLASARVVAFSVGNRLARLARQVPAHLTRPARDRRSRERVQPVRRTVRRPPWKTIAAAAVILAAAGTVAFGRGALVSMPWLRPSVPTGTLVVETTPAGLDLFVDSAPQGKTPLTLTLPEGDHSVEVRGRGLSRTLPVRVVEGVRAVERLTWPVSHRTGTLRVDSEPPGAIVRIDGQPRGKTPLTIELPARVHTVELEARGGRAQQSVRVEPEMLTGVKIALFSGWMAVFAPVDVEIYESGRLLGTTEVERIMMPSGRHEIEFVNRRLGYRETRTVSIVPGDLTAVSLELPKGTLQIDLPAGYEVWVDGERVGETPLDPLQVSLGTHEVRLRHPMFGDRRQVVVVGLSERTRLSTDTLSAR